VLPCAHGITIPWWRRAICRPGRQVVMSVNPVQDWPPTRWCPVHTSDNCPWRICASCTLMSVKDPNPNPWCTVHAWDNKSIMFRWTLPPGAPLAGPLLLISCSSQRSPGYSLTGVPLAGDLWEWDPRDYSSKGCRLGG
jgi:hypothetical protein